MFSSCGLIGTDRRHRMTSETYSAIEIVKSSNKNKRRRQVIADELASKKKSDNDVAGAKLRYCNGSEVIVIDEEL